MEGIIPGYIQQYLPIVIFLVFACIVSGVLIAIPMVCAVRKGNPEKNSPYECGFEPFDQPRKEFDIRFYLVAILFVIFDLEIIYLFPWAVTLSKIGLFGFWSMIVFLTLLTAGFIYEWKKGALEWE